MIIGNRFKFRVLPVLTGLLVLPILMGLGFWQLERAKEKQDLQSEYDRRAHDVPIRISGELQSLEALRFYRVTVTGTYDSDYEILLDNRVHNGRAGYHVLTPLRIAYSDTRVLVNRGWVALGQSRTELPKVLAPDGRLTVTGLAIVPLKGGFHLGPPDRTDKPWHPVWQYLDLDRYRQRVSFPMQPVVVLMDPENTSGGFVRDWQRLDTGIAMHQGYAFQWFSLAVALAAIILFFGFRGDSTRKDA